MSTPQIEALRLEHTFAATPEEVFDAWTDPELLRRWWAAQPSWSSPGCDVDLRVGGRYTLRMSDQNGRVYAVAGEYREVRRPRRLVYTWCWEGEEGPDVGNVSLVTVEFHPHPPGTECPSCTTVVLEHAGLISAQSRANHRSGWIGALENLTRRLFDGGGQG
jgi:uncharacterized protein YndB with AHSA1/START domain